MTVLRCLALLVVAGCREATAPDVCYLLRTGAWLSAMGDTVATFTLREGPFSPCPNPLPAGWRRDG
jgi:hypothetical protein